MNEQYFFVRKLGLGKEVVTFSLVVTEVSRGGGMRWWRQEVAGFANILKKGSWKVITSSVQWFELSDKQNVRIGHKQLLQSVDLCDKSSVRTSLSVTSQPAGRVHSGRIPVIIGRACAQLIVGCHFRSTKSATLPCVQ